jgi:aspartyl-tRNA(Asn)/glutamyl-tRNA(Gln) amidotransferase subunit A
MIGTYALSSGYYDAYYVRAQKIRALIKRDFDQAFEKCDCVVCPTSPTAAFKIGEKTGDPLQMYLCDVFTVTCNIAGIAGLNLPCGFTSGEKPLPIGLQLLGQTFSEEKLLRIARMYEAATEWHKKRPKFN